MELTRYAEMNRMEIADVWRKIRDGKLMARSIQGKLEVFENVAEKAEPNAGLRSGAAKAPVEEGDIAPPERASHKAGASAQESLTWVAPPPHAVARQEHASTEVALLLDHLSLAKEENREILRLTQDSVKRITQMSEQIISMKDSLIQTRDDELMQLKQKANEQEAMIRRLRQEVEDMTILTKALISQEK